MDLRMQEVIARNDATFRAANERIRDVAEEQEMTELVPFICECAAEECTEIVRLSLDEYAAVRKEPTHFVNALGHHVAARGAAEIVDENDRYAVVQKVGRAGEVAEDLDPRSAA